MAAPRWNKDQEESQRSQVIPARRTTESCMRLTQITRRGQVLTDGNFQPGRALSNKKQKRNARRMIFISTSTPWTLRFYSLAFSKGTYFKDRRRPPVPNGCPGSRRTDHTRC